MNSTAPKPGLVVYTPDWDGKKKAVGDTVWFGDNILELPDLAGCRSRRSSSSPGRPGQGRAGGRGPARCQPRPGVQGTVVSLGRIFRVKSDSQPAIVFDAVIDLSESDPGLMRPGMAAGVDITISSKDRRPAACGRRARLSGGRHRGAEEGTFSEDLSR